MKRIIIKSLKFIINLLFRAYIKLNKDEFNQRIWSNNELKKISNLFRGNIINISAGNDFDKEGDFYKNYFANKESYTISNYKSYNTKSGYDEIILDLENDLPSGLENKFNTVFSHTVLEHVFKIEKAIQNLCQLSDDVIITVVPFLQSYHHEEEIYLDYWRFTPMALVKKFEEQGFKTIYLSWGKDPIGDIYIFHVVSCKPQGWETLIKLNEIQLSISAPGMERHRLKSKSIKKEERLLIKTLEKHMC